jgi:enoyl-CoA hydratase/carnithine racemase
MSERVAIRIDNAVADVRLNRPDKMNAIDHAMITALIEAGKSVGANPSVRAVVLSGQGRAFCAGLDFSLFNSMAGQGDSSEGRVLANIADKQDQSPANLAQRCAYIWQEIPIPVIAAVHGVAFGGGLQIALGADIRYIAKDARISIMEMKWGIIPDMSGTQTMRNLVRLDVMKELTFTGRIVEGPEAVKLGFATYLSENPLKDALDTANRIAAMNPDAIRAAKKLLNTTVRGPVDEGLNLEFELQASLIGQPNQIEAVMANLEKRPPKFKDPE